MLFDRQLDDLVINGLLATAPTGQTFFVDNSSVQKPNLKVTRYRTLSQALAKCVSGRGDRIILSPDHEETISTALTIQKSAVTVLGLSRGKKRPKIIDATTGNGTIGITVNADEFSFFGVDFVWNSTKGTTASLFQFTGNNIVVRDCNFTNHDRSNSVKRFIKIVSSTGTDLASADGDDASLPVTSATVTFTTRDIGKILRITAGTGWTTGNYTIIGVSGGGALLDRAAASDGAKTGGTFEMSTANDVVVDGCLFEYDVVTPTAGEAIQISGLVERWDVRNCTFIGDYSVSCISQISTIAYDLTIVHNEMRNSGTDNVAGGIDLLAGTTGYVDYNDVYHDNGTANTGIDFGACHLGPNNFISDDITKKGKSFGTAAS